MQGHPELDRRPCATCGLPKWVHDRRRVRAVLRGGKEHPFVEAVPSPGPQAAGALRSPA